MSHFAAVALIPKSRDKFNRCGRCRRIFRILYVIPYCGMYCRDCRPDVLKEIRPDGI